MDAPLRPVKFSRVFQSLKYSPWEDSYIPYTMLVKELAAIVSRHTQDILSDTETTEVMERIALPKAEQFTGGAESSQGAIILGEVVDELTDLELPTDPFAEWVQSVCSSRSKYEAFVETRMAEIAQFLDQRTELLQQTEQEVALVDSEAREAQVDELTTEHFVGRLTTLIIDFVDLNTEALHRLCQAYESLVGEEATQIQDGVDAFQDQTLHTISAQVVADHDLRVRLLEALTDAGTPPPSVDMSRSPSQAKLGGGGLMWREKSAVVVDALDVQDLEPGAIHKVWVRIVDSAMGTPLEVPVLVARGRLPGKTIGITAALHGNEVNGIPVIQSVFSMLNPDKMCGSVVGVLVANVLGYTQNTRGYGTSGKDLNRCFPGREDGDCEAQYVHAFFEKIVLQFDSLIDLHTASHGRENSVYCRADLGSDEIAAMARLQMPQIIVHNTSPDGSLRAEATLRGIPSVTTELGNASVHQRRVIQHARLGIFNVLSYYSIVATPIVSYDDRDTVVCGMSKWIYTTVGGVLRIKPRLTEWVEKGEEIARITSVFGDVVHKVTAPYRGIVIGRATNPVAASGDRILHLGRVVSSFAEESNDGHA